MSGRLFPKIRFQKKNQIEPKAVMQKHVAKDKVVLDTFF